MVLYSVQMLLAYGRALLKLVYTKNPKMLLLDIEASQVLPYDTVLATGWGGGGGD